MIGRIKTQARIIVSPDNPSWCGQHAGEGEVGDDFVPFMVHVNYAIYHRRDHINSELIAQQ